MSFSMKDRYLLHQVDSRDLMYENIMTALRHEVNTDMSRKTSIFCFISCLSVVISFTDLVLVPLVTPLDASFVSAKCGTRRQ